MSARTLWTVGKRLRCRCPIICRWNSNSNHHITAEEQNQKNEAAKIDEAALPPEPTFCCMSGCSNCVWIKYAQEITQLFDNGDVIAKKKISEKVHDPKFREYLFIQLGLKDLDQK